MAEEKILVVDDEKPIGDIVKFNLTKEGFEVYYADNGDDALELVEEIDPHLILLDIMLPGKDGIEVCREIRKKSNVPIIMLSAKDSEIDKVVGLEMGADDYVTKPFGNRELIARVKANLRRHSQSNMPEMEEGDNSEIKIGSLVIHPSSYTVTKDKEPIGLTHREFELLYYCAKHIGQVMTREHLLQKVWNYEYHGDLRTVDVTVRRLREKIEDNPSHPAWLMTRRGVGYYLKNPEQE